MCVRANKPYRVLVSDIALHDGNVDGQVCLLPSCVQQCIATQTLRCGIDDSK